LGACRVGCQTGHKFGQDFGVILHQPLNLTKKRKKRVFGQIMNGPPVSPSRNLQNAPTWRVRKHNFRPLFWGIFLPISAPYPQPSIISIPHQTITTPTLYNIIARRIGKDYPLYIQLPIPTHTQYKKEENAK